MDFRHAIITMPLQVARILKNLSSSEQEERIVPAPITSYVVSSKIQNNVCRLPWYCQDQGCCASDATPDKNRWAHFDQFLEDSMGDSD